MEVFKGQNILSFVKELPNDDACKAYLAKVKWQDGFRCMKCGHTKGCEKSGYKYHCYGCNHVESATANTLFHKVKFGLQKAFCVVFEMSTSSKSVSSIQMGKRFDIRQGTDWYLAHVKRALDKKLVIISSNQKHEYNFCDKVINIPDFK